MNYTGRCACGAVTAEVTGEPLAVRQCWCRQCRRAAAGSPTTNAMFAADDVTIAGDLAEYGYVAASGNTLTHLFCPGCGTQVMSRSSVRPQFRTLRIGFLNEPHGLKPTAAIWTREAPHWAVLDPEIEHFSGQPPAPGAKA